MLDGKVVFPVVRQALVEGTVLLLSNLGGVASPERLSLVELFVLDGLLLDGLLFLLVFVLIDFLDLGLLAFLLLLGLFLVILNFLKSGISAKSIDNVLGKYVPSRPPWSQRAVWGTR